MLTISKIIYYLVYSLKQESIFCVCGYIERVAHIYNSKLSLINNFVKILNRKWGVCVWGGEGFDSLLKLGPIYPKVLILLIKVLNFYF